MGYTTHYKIAYIGGARSGKSDLAEAKVLALSEKEKPIYLATAKIIDSEMKAKVNAHRENRKDAFQTVEEPVDIEKVISYAKSPLLFESLGMWINNMLFIKKSKSDITGIIERILLSNKTIVFVSDHVGLGIMPTNKLARQFIDISGEVNILLGRYCDEIYLSFAGLSLRIKPPLQ